MNSTENKLHSRECKCFSWKPVAAGALTVIGLTFLLNLFAVAIDLTAFTTNSQGVETLAVGGMIATALGLVVAMFASGWLAGYLGSRYCSKRHLGAFYGFLTWCLALVIMVFIASYLQHYVTFYTHFISGSTAANSVQAVSPGMQMTSVVQTGTGMAQKNIVISTYIVFVLFFLSAFACSLGGHCGMTYVNKDERM